MNTLKFVSNSFKEQLDETTIHSFRSDFFTNGIKCFYEFSNINNGVKNCLKVILTQNKTVELNKEPKDPEIQLECSGLVLQQYQSVWTVLAKPPVLTKTNINNTVYCNNLLVIGAYDVIEIRDGTVVTLYYDVLNHQWLMASTNSISVGKTVLDETSFEDGFSQSLKKVLNTEYKDLLESLDKKQCYTFGFKNPVLHPFNNEWDFWFVQSVSVSNFCTNVNSSSESSSTSNSDSTETVKSDCEESKISKDLYISYTAPIKNMTVQMPIKLNTKTQNLGSLFKKSITALDNFIKTGEKFYGFILRHKNTINQREPNYLIESSLMSKIRKTYYFNDFTKSATMLRCSRKEYVLANAFLTNRKLFLDMFPQFKKTFDEYNIIANNLVNKAMKIASGFFKAPVNKTYAALVKKTSSESKKLNESKTPEYTEEVKNSIESIINTIDNNTVHSSSNQNFDELQTIDNNYHTFASKIYIQISQKLTIKNANEEYYRNLYEYIMSPQNISIFIHLHSLHTKLNYSFEKIKA